ncbi:HYR-like domain-containing protein, partial [Portibacter marinus]
MKYSLPSTFKFNETYTLIILIISICLAFSSKSISQCTSATCGSCGNYTYPGDFVGNQQAAVNIDQGSNGKLPNVKSPVDFQNGNLNVNNSHFVEGHSVPYRVHMKNLVLCEPVRITIEWDALQSGHIATDFLTHYQGLEPHTAPFGHSSEIVNPLINDNGVNVSAECGFSLNSPTSEFSFPEPCASDAPSNTTLQQIYADYESQYGDQKMTAWGATICDMWYGAEDGSIACADLSTSCLNGGTTTTKQQLTIEFIPTHSQAIFAWGGHLARFQDWGICGTELATASGLSGSPYHMRVDCWTYNSVGNQDRSLKIDAVFVDPPCDFTGDAFLCPGEIGSYTGPDDLTSYSWTLNPSNGASFVNGVNNTQTVQVQAGNGPFTLKLVTTIDVIGRGTFTSTTDCQLTVDVNAPSFTTTSPAGVCSPNTADLTDPNVIVGCNGTISYWEDEDASVPISDPSAVSAGSYFIKCTDANGCFTIKEVIVPGGTPPDFVVTGPSSVCDGGLIDLTGILNSCTGDNELTYWNDMDLTSEVADPTMVGVGTYYFKCTDPVSGCFSVQPVIVDEFSTQPEVSVSSAPTCENIPATVTATLTNMDNPPYTYDWIVPAGASIPNNTTSSFMTSVEGTYSVTVTDGNGCTDEGSVDVVIYSNSTCNAPLSENLPVCSSQGTINNDFALWKAQFTYSLGTAPNATVVFYINDVVVSQSDFDNASLPDGIECGGSLKLGIEVDDDCIDAELCEAVFSVGSDTEAPVISGVGPDGSVECPAGPVFSTPAAEDACDPDPSLTFVDQRTDGDCPQEYSITRTWTAKDACGNTSTASQTIKVTD